MNIAVETVTRIYGVEDRHLRPMGGDCGVVAMLRVLILGVRGIMQRINELKGAPGG